MSSIKLKHSSGNSVSIAAPESNPASDRTLYVPSNANGTILTNTTPGCILQIVQTVKTDTTSHDTNTWTDISGLSLSITPSSVSNKILISFHGSGSTTNIGFIRLLRDSTEIGSGGSAGSRVSCACMFHRSGDSNLLESFGNSYLVSPSSTCAVTYKLQWRDESGTIYLNRSVNDHNTIAGSRTSSVITAMEVAG